MNWGAWGAKLNSKDMAQLVENCVKIGVSTFDHADIYGHYTTEADFGAAFSESKLDRKDIEIITKCGICMPSDNKPEFKIKSYNTTDAYIKQQVDASLNNLQTEYLDVLLIHRPSPMMDYHQIAQTFTDLQAAGKVNDFGVSNFTKYQFDTLDKMTSNPNAGFRDAVRVDQISVRCSEAERQFGHRVLRPTATLC